MKTTLPSLLWEIRPPHPAPPSYLFGTIHVNLPEVFHRFEDACRYIDACVAFATEIPLSNVGEPSQTVVPLHLPLVRLLGSKQFDHLRKAVLKYLRFDLLFDQHLPLPVLLALLQQRLVSSQDQAAVLDASLWSYAAQQGKKMLGIETITEQERFLAKFPLTEQLRMLKRIGRNIPGQKQQLQKLLSLYQQEDLTAIQHHSNKGDGFSRKVLLHQRNRTMAERIAAYACQDPIFVAIGAAHLGGAKGVLRLLKQQGFSIKPIFSSSIQSNTP